MAPSGFPRFSDGNVEIQFSEEGEKYVLHSWQLSLHSPWFKASLSDRWKSAGSATTVAGTNHWVYELRFDKGSDLGTFVQKASPDAPSPKDTELITNCEPLAVAGSEHAKRELHSKRIQILQAHQDMLGSIYHVLPKFCRGFAIFSNSKSSILELVKVAKMYDCENIARLQIDYFLRTCQDEVELQCVRDPVSMLEFSLTVRSSWIFTEAATHLLGRSNRFYEQSEDTLMELEISELFEKHRSQFVDRLRKCELEMFRIQQPQDSSWLGHAALAFFRQWLTEQLQAGKGSGLGPGYANLYHTIDKGTFSYKTQAQKQQVQAYMNRVTENFTEENLRDLEPELRKIFNKAAAVVEPIVTQHTHRKTTLKDNYRALTFHIIDFNDIPAGLYFYE